MRGTLNCVVPNKMMRSTESTEVFTINVSSNGDLEQMRRDLESQSKNEQCIRKKLFWRLGFDIPIFIIVCTVIGLFELGVIPSNKSGFYCNDPALSYKFNGDTVSTTILMSCVLIVPIIVFMTTELVFIENFESQKLSQVLRNSGWLYRSYLYGLAVNLFIIEAMKGIMGSPRPVFFDLCEPDAGKTCSGSEFVNTFTCTSSKYTWWTQMDSYRSFPSGHASISVYCGFFIAWYLQKRAFNWHNKTVLLVPLIQMLSISFSVISSLTRITDHRHHWWDVLVGFGIGVVTVFYGIYILNDNFSSTKMKTEKSESVKTTRTLLYDEPLQI